MLMVSKECVAALNRWTKSSSTSWGTERDHGARTGGVRDPDLGIQISATGMHGDGRRGDGTRMPNAILLPRSRAT